MTLFDEYEEQVNQLSDAILDGLNSNPLIDPRVIVGALSHALVLAIKNLPFSDKQKQNAMHELFMISSNSLDNMLKKAEDGQLTH